MNKIDALQFALLSLNLGFAVALGVWMALRQRDLQKQWYEFQERRKKLYEKLADHKKIEREMEAGARLREMHDAKRTALPRDDAGPPAVIRKLPSSAIRGKKAKP